MVKIEMKIKWEKEMKARKPNKKNLKIILEKKHNF